jgi:hypothetical protein
MNPEKSQLKIVFANNLGADLEDRLEGERKAMHELAGAAQALRQASRKVVADLIARLEAEQGESEKVIKDGLEAHLVVQKIKQWLTRAGDFLGHLADVEQQKAVAQGGRSAGLEDAMKLVKKIQDDEAAKLQRMAELAQAPEDTVVARTEGGAARREHGTVAERRQAEREGPAVEELATAPEELPAPVKAKRGRKKKA